MSELMNKYINKKKIELSDAARKARTMKYCYFFLLPYAVLFLTFNILPIINSIYYGFTDFNILEKAEFIGARNYINLFLQDEVILKVIRKKSVKTFYPEYTSGLLQYFFCFFPVDFAEQGGYIRVEYFVMTVFRLHQLKDGIFDTPIFKDDTVCGNDTAGTVAPEQTMDQHRLGGIAENSQDFIQIIFRYFICVQGDIVQSDRIFPFSVDGGNMLFTAATVAQIQYAAESVEGVERFKFIFIRLSGTVNIFIDFMKIPG